MIIVGSPPRVALPVARSLARRGICVILASASADEGPIRSRSIRSYVQLPDARESAHEFDRRLEALIGSASADLLVPCSDKALAAIARNYDALRALTDPGCPPAATIKRVLDKSVTLDAAMRLGIAVPETYDLSDRSATAELTRQIAYPVIAKARDQSRTGGFRVRYYENAAQLDAAIAADTDFGARHVLQRWVAGHGEGVAALMHGGEAMAVFQHRRLKELPSAGGVSVVSESVAPEPALVAQSIALLREIGWEGVAQVEYRRDGSGTPWLMEINGRYWGSLSTALAAGVDFPYYQWQVSHGFVPNVPGEYPIGVRVRWTRGAIMRLRERVFDTSGPPRRRSSPRDEFASFASDFGKDVRSAIWSPADPLPAAMDAFPAIGRLAGSAIRGVIKAALPRPLRRAYRRFGPSGMFGYASLRMGRLLNPGRDVIPLTTRPPSVLFVCSGNIMRSPLAAAAFESSARAAGGGSITVDSCGLHAENGTPPDPRAAGVAEALGLDLGAHRAKRMTQMLADGANMIVVMERFQQFEAARAYPGCAQKVYVLGYCVPGSTGLDIPDPYSEDDAEAARLLGIVAARAAALATTITGEGSD